MDSKSGTIYYTDGTTDVLFDEAAVQVKEKLRQNEIHPQGVLNFDNVSYFMMNIKKIEWNF